MDLQLDKINYQQLKDLAIRIQNNKNTRVQTNKFLTLRQGEMSVFEYAQDF